MPRSASRWQRAGAAITETFIVARLAVRLYSYLGLGWRWTFMLLRLIVYALLLMPGFAQMVVFYMVSPRVRRSLVYGKAPRNRLDLYLPPAKAHNGSHAAAVPVVIYITGGAWTIGYKAWGSLLARRLSKQGVLVACLDYRNFPQGTILDMLEDVNAGIAWTLEHAEEHGGDAQHTYLVGQSCGAQLAALALLTQAEQEAQEAELPGGSPRWAPARIRALVGVSGVYNVAGLADHFHERGLYRPLLERIMSQDGQPELRLFSPAHCIKGVKWGGRLPRVVLLHGTADRCALVGNAEQFAEALRDAGAQVEVVLYEGETHTSPLIENPMRGGRDRLTDDVLARVLERPGMESRQAPMCPGLLIRAAAAVCPF
ncbi:hypothetical protein WJX81_002179 [Elliptochloris bilobata]|uniref:protein-S-isoprenylcysteine alpha-carbonyl methylesterase n=1 Tax=Elliptochloris bilobata TaxID=381761 RepID=A0AAW1QHW0_9CHLO